MFEAILFDLDETLHSREAAFWRWIEEELQTAPSHRIDRAEIAALDARGRGDKRLLLEHLNESLAWQLPHGARVERFRSGVTRWLELDERVRAMLARLATRYRLGLVTNGTAETQRRKLEKLGLESAFDPVVISEEVGFKKPDERIFRVALDRLGSPAHRVAFVGDDPVADIAGAQALGMVAVQVGKGAPLEHVLGLERWLETYRAGEPPPSA